MNGPPSRNRRSPSATLRAGFRLRASRSAQDDIVKARSGWRRGVAGSNVVEGKGDFGDNEGVNKKRVIKMLRQHQEELRAAGVVHLSVFGSVARGSSVARWGSVVRGGLVARWGWVARGDASEKSDVDLMADFGEPERLTLVKIGSLEHRLTEWLGVEVELSSAEWMREPVRSKAIREAVVAF